MTRDTQISGHGLPRSCTDTESCDQIVVIGGGPGGLVCAYLLAKRGFQVRLIERRTDPVSQPLPQYGHVHNLLLSSYYAACKAIPELEDRLKAAGGARVDWNDEFRRATPEGVAAQSPSLDRVIVAPRHTWDEVLWSLLKDNTTATIEHAHVASLQYDHGSKRMQVHVSGAETEPLRELSAPLLIDASGRARVGARCLRQAGFEIPTRTVMTPMEYRSVRFQRLASSPRTAAKAAVEVSKPSTGELRGAMGLPDGRGTLVVSAVSSNKSGLAQFAESPVKWLEQLPWGLVRDLVAQFEPIADTHRRFGWSNNDIVRFDQLSGDIPFIALGDALAATAPILGLGMSRAIEDAVYLAHALDRVEPLARIAPIRKRLHRAAARDFKLAEALALELSGTEALTSSQRVSSWLRDRFLQTATRDPILHQVYIDRRNRLIPAWRLLHPRILLRFTCDLLRSLYARPKSVLATRSGSDST